MKTTTILAIAVLAFTIIFGIAFHSLSHEDLGNATTLIGVIVSVLLGIPQFLDWAEKQKNTPTFKKFLKNHPIKQRTSGNPFDYRAGNIDLHGREEEQKRLRRFLDGSARVWAITGHGGMGKSKLAFHMALEYKHEKWNVFWLTETTIKELKGCKIDTTGKHLFICDYAGRYVNEIAELLKRLHENRVDYKMLLLERAPYGSNTDSTNWFCKLRDNEAVKDLFQSQGLEYAENPSEPAPLNMTEHPLDDTAYGKILDDFSEKKLNEKQKQEIIAFVRNGMRNKPHEARNEDNRCLFLLLAADVVMDGKSLQQLDKTQVFHSYIEKKLDSHFPPELEECKETALLLLVLATAGGAFDLREERVDSAEAWRTELLKKLPQKTSAIAQVLAALCERGDEETTITPLYPDLLGEYLVMWYYYEYPKKELFPLLFSPDCFDHFVDFLTRLCTDWYGNENAQMFFADAKKWAEEKGDNADKLLIAQVYSALGSMLDDMLDFDAAIAQYKEAILLKIAAGGEESPSLAATYNNLGVAYDNKGKYDKAIELYKKALGIYEIHPAYKAHPETAATYYNLGNAYSNKDKYDEAIEQYKKALDIQKQVYGEEHPETAGVYNNLGDAYIRNKEYYDAIDWLQKVLNIYENHPEYKTHPNIAITCYNFADAYKELKNYPLARIFITQALAIFLEKSGEEHPQTKQALDLQEEIERLSSLPPEE